VQAVRVVACLCICTFVQVLRVAMCDPDKSRCAGICVFQWCSEVCASSWACVHSTCAHAYAAVRTPIACGYICEQCVPAVWADSWHTCYLCTVRCEPVCVHVYPCAAKKVSLVVCQLS
jgi:hypothetical protein